MLSFPNAVSVSRLKIGEALPAGCLLAILLLLPLLAGGNELYAPVAALKLAGLFLSVPAGTIQDLGHVLMSETISPATALLILQCLVLLLVVLWWIVRLDHWRWTALPRLIWAPLLVFAVISVTATVTSLTPYQSELKLLQTGFGLMLAYAAVDLLRTERALHRAAWVVLWSGGIAAVYGIDQGIYALPNWLVQAQTNRASQDLIEMVSQGRVFGTFLNVNAFAAYLAMVLPVGAYLLVHAERKRHQMLAAGLLLCLIVALAMTGSKGGWGAAIAAVAVTGFVLARQGRGVRLVKRLGFVALTAVLLVGFLWATQPSQLENPMERLFAVTMGLKMSVEGRWSYWQGAGELIAQHPLLGGGPGTFGVQFQQVQDGGHYARYAHNLYLQMASEIGLAGLVAFLAVVGGMVLLVRRLRQLRTFGAVLLTSAGALLLHGLVDFSWEVPANQWLFFVFFGMIVACDRIERGDPVPARELGQRGRAIGTLAAVPLAALLLLLIGRPYLAEGYLQSAIAASIADDTELTMELGLEAVRHAPRSARSANFLATSYRRKWEKSGKAAWLDQAAEWHRAAIESAPSVGLYHHEFGKTLWAMERPEEAVASWTTAHARYPINPDFAVQLGRGLWATGQPVKALALLEETATLEPVFLAAGSPEVRPFYDLHFLMAKIYEEQGRPDAAVDEYRRIIALGERGPERIAYTPLLAGRIAISPKIWYVSKSHLEMGDLYQRQGQMEPALAAYRRAVDIDPNYEKAKQRIEALEAKAGVKRS